MARVEHHPGPDDGSDNRWGFDCPGCGMPHEVRVGVPDRPCWTFNFDVDRPTFSPSILVTYPANPNAAEEFKEWRRTRICHSYVRNGRIEFLSDCTHALAGKTVDLPELADG